MKAIKMNNFSTVRKPTLEEISRISKYVQKYNLSQIKISKALSTVFTVVGLFLTGSIGFNAGEPTIVALILGLLCFALVFIFIRSKNKCVNENIGFLSGEFFVIDGIVSKIQTNADNPGCVNVYFLSNDKEINNGWYRARQENIEIGSDLLLVIPNSKRTERFSKHVFSNFMLTDDGIKLHW